jgi:hypothetical protein
MIRKPTEVTEKKLFKALIYGIPGIGKSTLGVSAPNPLLIDTDGGYDRIPVQFRPPVIQPESYEEILADLKKDNPELEGFETLVFDTGGSMLTYMKQWAIKKDMKNGQRDGITLSMRGYGAVGNEFMRLMNYCVNILQRNIIVIFHAKEKMDNDETVYRLDVEGQTKNNIWKIMDIGGMMFKQGGKRVIGFTPDDKYDAKGTHGLSGLMEIPDIKNGNTFMTDLFNRLNQNIAEESQYIDKYNNVMKEIESIISRIESLVTANKALEELGEVTHIFSSKREAWTRIKSKCDTLGLAYKDGQFVKG